MWDLIIGGLIGFSIVLFQTNHAFWGFILIGLILRIFKTEKCERDLEWISNALMDPRELDSLKKERSLYIFLQRCMNDKKIYKNMLINDLQKVVAESTEYNVLTKVKLDYLSDKNRTTEIRKIYIRGYGCGVPTPRIIMKARAGKLICLKRNAIWA